MMIAKKTNKRERLAFFYCCRPRRLNSIRQVNGDLPDPIVCAASEQLSTLSAHFSTLSTHGRVWDDFAFPYAPQRCSPLVDRPCFAPDGENPGKHAPVRLPSLETLASLAVGK
jgi:hypothetical protein